MLQSVKDERFLNPPNNNGIGDGITQDEATSAIFGMPRAAAERGAELIVPLEEISSVLCSVRPLVRLG